LKKFYCLSLIIVAVFFATPSSQAAKIIGVAVENDFNGVDIDFESIGPDQLITADISGVTFSTSWGSHGDLQSPSINGQRSLVNYEYNSMDVEKYITLNFSTPVIAVGFLAQTSNNRKTTIRAFDSQGKYLGKKMFRTEQAQPTFVGVASDEFNPIDSIQISVNGDKYLTMDDLRFNSVYHIPEPTTIGFLSLGIMFFAYRRKRNLTR